MSREIADAVLVDALTSAADGAGRFVLILGEAGIGKTTSARAAAAVARRNGLAVRWTACSSTGSTVSHAPWLSLLAGLGEAGRAATAALQGSDVGDHASASATAARSAAYAAVPAALAAVGAERPLLLVLDDLHWADEGSIHLLEVVAGQLPAVPVAVIGTYRSTDVAPGSALTRLGAGADRVELHGLDVGGVATLLGSHIGAAAEQTASEVRDLTAGNPFLVVQLGRLLADDPSALRRGSLPTGARDLLEQRLAALPPSDRGVLLAAAVIGSPFRVVDVAAITSRTAGDVDAVLSRAAGARIVERAPGTGAWSFVHDLFRQATLDGADASSLAALHAQAAEAMARAEAEPAVVASLLLQSGAVHRAAAAEWSVRAGDRALDGFAWEEAADHFGRALLALDPGVADAVRVDALAGVGRARLLMGDDAGATEAFEELADTGRSLGEPELVARAALGWSADLSGFEVRLFDQRQIDLLEEADRALGAAPSADPALRATVLARLSVALSLVAPSNRRLSLADDAVRLARTADDPTVLARALAAHCDAISGPDRSEDREAEASEVIDIAVRAGDGVLELLGRRLRYVARLEQGDVAGVEEDVAAFGRRASAIGNPLYLWYVPLWQAQSAIVAGDLEAAAEGIAEVESLGAAAGSTNAPVLATVLRLALYEAGDRFDAVIDALEDMRLHAPDVAQHISSLGALALAHHGAGLGAQADALLDRAHALGIDAVPFDAEWLPNATSLLAAAAERGHPILEEVLDRLEPWAHRVSFEGIGAGLYGSTSRYVAIGCAAAGRPEDAERYASLAVEVDRRFGGSVLASSVRTLAACGGPDGPPPGRSARREPERDRHGSPNELRRAGEMWHVSYGGEDAILRHSKGIADLAVLLGRPGTEVHVSELGGVPRALTAGDGGEALDRAAIAAYRERLGQLAAEVDDADAAHDPVRKEVAQAEYDALVEQLSGAVGLGGRVRSAGPEPVERLRKAVSARVRDAIRRIDAVHPLLGRHLSNAVHTGTYCSYRPEVATTWHCQN